MILIMFCQSNDAKEPVKPFSCCQGEGKQEVKVDTSAWIENIVRRDDRCPVKKDKPHKTRMAIDKKFLNKG